MGIIPAEPPFLLQRQRHPLLCASTLRYQSEILVLDELCGPVQKSADQILDPLQPHKHPLSLAPDLQCSGRID